MHSRNPVLLIPGFLWMSPFSWVSTGVLSLQTSAQRQWRSREYLGGDNVIDSEVLGEFLGLKDSNISQQPRVFFSSGLGSALLQFRGPDGFGPSPGIRNLSFG